MNTLLFEVGYLLAVFGTVVLLYHIGSVTYVMGRWYGVERSLGTIGFVLCCMAFFTVLIGGPALVGELKHVSIVPQGTYPRTLTHIFAVASGLFTGWQTRLAIRSF